MRTPFVALVLLLAVGTAHAQPDGGLRAMGFAPDDLERTEPLSANPYLAYLVPGVTPDYEYWTARTIFDSFERGRTRALRGFRSAPTGEYRERERALFNRNDDFDTAELLEGFDARTEPILSIEGRIEPVESVVVSRQTVDDEGDVQWGVGRAFTPHRLQLANSAGTLGTTVVTGTIGDGAYAATSGDVDVYEFETLDDDLYVEIVVQTPGSDLNAGVALYDADGLSYGGGHGRQGRAPGIGAILGEAGTYRIYVWGYSEDSRYPGYVARPPGLIDRNDPRSGHGIGSTGSYELHVSAAQPDADAYTVDLQAGDVLAAVTGSSAVDDLAIYGPDRTLRMRSRYDLSGYYPEEGPLISASELTSIRSLGVSAAMVAPDPGRYTVVVRGGGGNYSMRLQGSRPGHEREGGQPVETIFVDIRGGKHYPARDIGVGADSTFLSPLSEYLPRWGLRPSDEDAVLDTILGILQRTLRDALRTDVPGMANLELRILNSRDHADPGPGVNRLVIAGDAEQIGEDGFYGKASSVDIGNFRQNDIAYVVLGTFSNPANDSRSLNYIAVDSTRTKAELVGLGLGKTAAHEAAHFFGLHHTENENGTSNIIDEGGAPLWKALGIGRDWTFGPGDGGNLRFREDTIVLAYPMAGAQRSADALAHSLAVGQSTAATPESGGTASDAGALMDVYRFSGAVRDRVVASGRPARLLVDEAFNGDPSVWSKQFEDGSERYVEAGSVVIRAGAGYIYNVPLSLPSAPSQGDLVARLDFRYVDGCPNNGGGLSLRRTEGSQLLFKTDASGASWTRISRRQNGTWNSPTEWREAPGARSNEWNTAEVVAIGTQLSLYLNGTLAQEATVEAPSGETTVGLFVDACAEDAMAYRFDNLTVLSLDRPALRASGTRSFQSSSASGVRDVPSAASEGVPSGE